MSDRPRAQLRPAHWVVLLLALAPAWKLGERWREEKKKEDKRKENKRISQRKRREEDKN